MEINKVKETLNAELLCGEALVKRNVNEIFACDMMSDVLAYAKPIDLLVTGLINVQVIRTAEMIDVKAIVFVRSKRPSQEMIDMARECDIALMSTNLKTYETCGKLYKEDQEDKGNDR